MIIFLPFEFYMKMLELSNLFAPSRVETELDCRRCYNVNEEDNMILGSLSHLLFVIAIIIDLLSIKWRSSARFLFFIEFWQILIS